MLCETPKIWLKIEYGNPSETHSEVVNRGKCTLMLAGVSQTWVRICATPRTISSPVTVEGMRREMDETRNEQMHICYNITSQYCQVCATNLLNESHTQTSLFALRSVALHQCQEQVNEMISQSFCRVSQPRLLAWVGSASLWRSTHWDLLWMH